MCLQVCVCVSSFSRHVQILVRVYQKMQKSGYLGYLHLLERSFSKDCFHLRHSSRVGLKIDDARLDSTQNYKLAHSDDECEMSW